MSNLKAEYDAYWRATVSTQPKMRTYIRFKSNLGMEDYLTILPAEHRRVFTRFRISAHNLAIERGRYTRPPTPIEERTCKHCPQVEDESHVLMQCTEYSEQRAALFEEIKPMCPRFTDLSESDKFVYLMSATGDIVKAVARFINSCCT